MNTHKVSFYPSGVRHFLHAYPVKNPKNSSRVSQIAFDVQENVPNYKRNVYYFWWEFLRLNEDYKKCCLGNVDASRATLFSHFGDVHDTDDFWDWWKRHIDLFCETASGAVKEIKQVLENEDDNAVYIRIPLHLNSAYIEKRIKEIVTKRKTSGLSDGSISTAKYPVSTSPSLKTLYYCLRCYQLRMEHPEFSNNQIADELGIVTNSTRDAIDTDKQLRDMVTRYLRQAKQLVENTGKGEFPGIIKR